MSKSSSTFNFRRSASADSQGSTADGRWVPNTDVCVNAEGLVIRAELAGMRREDLELTVEGNTLRIRGCRTDGARPANCSFLVMEISYGCFESAIELPEGFDLNEAKAVYQNGFLRVTVPRKAARKKTAHVVPVTHNGRD